MGHSYVEFRGQALHRRDIDIVLFVRCLLAEWKRSRSSVPQSERLETMFAFWMTAEAFPGPGCFNLQLDEFIVTEEDRKRLLDTIVCAEKRIVSYGGKAPSQYLNEVNEPPGYDFVDQPSEHVLDILQGFRDLIAKECR